MALGSTCFTANSNFAYADTFCVITSQDNANIYASYDNGNNMAVYVRLAVTEYKSGAWQTIETKSLGLVSGNVTKHVQFSNYSTAGDRTMRISVRLYANSSYTDTMQVEYSGSWIR